MAPPASFLPTESSWLRSQTALPPAAYVMGEMRMCVRKSSRARYRDNVRTCMNWCSQPPNAQPHRICGTSCVNKISNDKFSKMDHSDEVGASERVIRV